jgi:hypothetical protein
MSPLQIHRARLLGQAVLWLALGVALGLAFGNSLIGAAEWVVVAVIVGLVVRRHREIAAWVRTRRRGR